VIGVRGKQSRLAALSRSLVAVALAQVTACGSCVKDDPAPASFDAAGERKPIDLRAADKRLSQYSETAQLGQDGGSSRVSDAAGD